jgi:hypothetical protein
MAFDPDFSLDNIGSGFRIFATGESLNAIAAEQYKTGGPGPSPITVFLHADILYPGEFGSSIRAKQKLIL